MSPTYNRSCTVTDMNNTTATTITLTINGETREIPATRYETADGEVRYNIDYENLIAVRIGHGAKWHKPTHVVVAEKNGKPVICNGVALNKSASYFGWAESIKNNTTKSEHVGSKIN